MLQIDNKENYEKIQCSLFLGQFFYKAVKNIYGTNLKATPQTE